MSDMHSGLSWVPEWLKCLVTVIKVIFFVGLNPLELHVCRNTVQEWNCKRILSACEKKKKNKHLVTSFSSKNGIFLGMWFCAPPGCSGYIQFRLSTTTGYCLNDTKEKTCFLPRNGCPCDYTLYTNVTPLNLQSINCLMLWIKLAIIGLERWLSN